MRLAHPFRAIPSTLDQTFPIFVAPKIRVLDDLTWPYRNWLG
jgi:hypothetical protein